MKRVDVRGLVEALAGSWMSPPARREERLNSLNSAPPRELEVLAARCRGGHPVYDHFTKMDKKT